jgi:hypothetical protein
MPGSGQTRAKAKGWGKRGLAHGLAEKLAAFPVAGRMRHHMLVANDRGE